MGLIKAAIQSTGSVLADQYQEFFTCDSLGSDILVYRGAKKIKNGSNKGDSDVITNGSRVAVPEGMALLLVDNGKVVDFTTEAGLYTWDTSSAPSCFGASGFLDGTKKSIGELWSRLKSGGVINSEQRVYFINMLENFDNKFGTPAPVPYFDPDYMDIFIRLNGVFSFRIENPVVFFQSVAGNVASVYTKETLMAQAKTEFISKFSEAVNQCSVDSIKYSRLPSEQTRLTKYMNDALDEDWLAARGLVVASVGIGGITPDDESRKRITDFARDIKLGQNPEMLAARAVAMNAEAQVAAANNANGAMTGIMGMGMIGGMNQVGGGNAAAFDYLSKNQTAQAAAPSSAGWTCVCGHAGNAGKFCAECGKPKPEPIGTWDCACGAKANMGKFCSECGKPKPASGCAACGYKPQAGEPTPKFCPECGKPIV